MIYHISNWYWFHSIYNRQTDEPRYKKKHIHGIHSIFHIAFLEYLLNFAFSDFVQEKIYTFISFKRIHMAHLAHVDCSEQFNKRFSASVNICRCYVEKSMWRWYVVRATVHRERERESKITGGVYMLHSSIIGIGKGRSARSEIERIQNNSWFCIWQRHFKYLLSFLQSFENLNKRCVIR